MSYFPRIFVQYKLRSDTCLFLNMQVEHADLIFMSQHDTNRKHREPDSNLDTSIGPLDFFLSFLRRRGGGLPVSHVLGSARKVSAILFDRSFAFVPSRILFVAPDTQT